MQEQAQHVDLTEAYVFTGQFPIRLQQLGFKVIQTIDTQGRDVAMFVLPPVKTVPAGLFWMGSDPEGDIYADSNEFPQHKVWLDTFNICEFPVTVEEWRYALLDTQQAESRLLAPPYWQQMLQHLDMPICNITWYEARAYAGWLSRVSGIYWQLVSEAEWEKAARGTTGRYAAWQRAPYFGVDQASLLSVYPIGLHSECASPYGVQEMGYNVVEWTSSLYVPYPYNALDGREDVATYGAHVRRGYRGPSLRTHMRAASRLQAGSSFIFVDGGMRLAAYNNIANIQQTGK
jgi:formylglycine-generating enzyme required for sulfatase activity